MVALPTDTLMILLAIAFGIGLLAGLYLGIRICRGLTQSMKEIERQDKEHRNG